MTLTLKVNEFGALATSGTLDEAVREPDFMKRAIKLFNLRETIWSAFTHTKEEIEEETAKEARSRALTPGRIALAIGAAAAAGAVFVMAAPIDLFIMGVAGLAALAFGFTARGITRAIVKSGPETEGEEAQKLLEYSRKNMAERIETEIQRMDNSLFSQTPAVRDEFRSAFQHAATKQETREARIHRAKMEAEAEETREAAQTAATMATMAAVSASMASMSHRK